jgi:hypothetical protein
MTIDEFKESNGLRWLDVARMLTETGYCEVLENRLTRLRSGKTTPTCCEIKALLEITDNEVDSFR